MISVSLLVDSGAIINCLFVFFTSFLAFFLSYLVPNLSTSASISPFRFQVGGRKRP